MSKHFEFALEYVIINKATFHFFSTSYKYFEKLTCGPYLWFVVNHVIRPMMNRFGEGLLIKIFLWLKYLGTG